MNDITALAQQLRATAEKANEHGEFNMAMHTVEVLALVEALEKREELRASANRVVNQQDIELQELRQRNAELVEALEKAQSANAAQDDHINQQQDRIDQLEKGHQEAAKQINSWRRVVKQNIAEREKDISELDAARQRIAELESRTVTVTLPLPRRKTADDYVDDTFEPCDLAAIYNACRLECEVKFKKALLAAGVPVIEGEG